MNKMQQQVIDFHDKMMFGKISKHLRAALITEEASELVQALLRDDKVEAVDGICDLLYVTLGAAIHYGIDIEPYFNEVHRTNMLKGDGPIRSDGKKLKPKDWQPPRIKEMLEDGIGSM